MKNTLYHKWLLFVFLGLVLTFFGCEDNSTESPIEDDPIATPAGDFPYILATSANDLPVRCLSES